MRIYIDGGGLKAFWVGNGLNVTKIFPVSLVDASKQSLHLCSSCFVPNSSAFIRSLILTWHHLPAIQESAIKFVSYEQSKKFLAKYWDKVSDPSELSSSSRFIAGGIGGITSQFAIYGLETLKTRVQSDIGPAQGTKAIIQTARVMWRTGGIRAYYRGLTVSTRSPLNHTRLFYSPSLPYGGFINPRSSRYHFAYPLRLPDLRCSMRKC